MERRDQELLIAGLIRGLGSSLKNRRIYPADHPLVRAPVEKVFKVNEGRPNVADHMLSGNIDLMINTPLGRESFYDDGAIRKNATLHGVLCVTTLTGAAATVQGIRALRQHEMDVLSLQEIHAGG